VVACRHDQRCSRRGSVSSIRFPVRPVCSGAAGDAKAGLRFVDVGQIDDRWRRSVSPASSCRVATRTILSVPPVTCVNWIPAFAGMTSSGMDNTVRATLVRGVGPNECGHYELLVQRVAIASRAVARVWSMSELVWTVLVYQRPRPMRRTPRSRMAATKRA